MGILDLISRINVYGKNIEIYRDEMDGTISYFPEFRTREVMVNEHERKVIVTSDDDIEFLFLRMAAYQSTRTRLQRDDIRIIRLSVR